MLMDIRNVAIIAHVDHGKTTLVDAILKQSHIFRDNQKETSQVLLMDTNALEREKGITILSKNTAVRYKNTKINIIDTPGHADFGSEVERILNMASGALLLVDAAEGPLPQTRFVLKEALKKQLKIILFINKIDKKDARPQEVQREIENLFLDVAREDHALDFQTLYGVGRDGKAYKTLPSAYSADLPGDITPLFETIIEEVPNSHKNQDKPLKLLFSTLDYDNYVGRLGIGKISQGTLHKGDRISLVDQKSVIGTYTATKLYINYGLGRQEVDTIEAGDIATLAGIPDLKIGQTATDPDHPDPLPAIEVTEPTIRIGIGANTSPFTGHEGDLVTSRQIKVRLEKELETNLGLQIEENPTENNFIVSGRGELHLAVLIETMRREGFELEVSKPQVIYKTIYGQKCEPFEEVTIDVDKEFVGAISEEFGRRKAQLIDMHAVRGTTMRFVYKVSSNNLMGIRSILLTNTRGTAMIHTYLLGYEKVQPAQENIRNGVLISTHTGQTLTYGLANAQIRGTLFYGPGEKVYEGMVVGISSSESNIEINVCRAKKLTNNRSSGEGTKTILEPPTKLSLEQYLDFIGQDELLEVTPQHLRLRKRYLTQNARRIVARQSA
ncbi:translational GTPase TypA [Candidatus Woesebacteria bacterium]|nr:translational GTPase TypA [Candidatus Woesebacteria bacterium]